MNRNLKEKENHPRNDYDNVKYIEPIPPKFSANWSQNIRFDKIIINVSGILFFIPRLLVRSSPQSRQITQVESQKRPQLPRLGCLVDRLGR